MDRNTLTCFHADSFIVGMGIDVHALAHCGCQRIDKSLVSGIQLWSSGSLACTLPHWAILTDLGAHFNDSSHHSVTRDAASKVICDNIKNTLNYINLNEIILIHETIKRMKSVFWRWNKGETGRWCSMTTLIYWVLRSCLVEEGKTRSSESGEVRRKKGGKVAQQFLRVSSWVLLSL